MTATSHSVGVFGPSSRSTGGSAPHRIAAAITKAHESSRSPTSARVSAFGRLNDIATRIAVPEIAATTTGARPRAPIR